MRMSLRRALPKRTLVGVVAACGKVVLSYGVGNHVDLRGLRGGAEGIRTDGHRSLRAASSATSTRKASG